MAATTAAPIEDVICIGCGLPALARCTTEAGRREVAISRLCEPCWKVWSGADLEDDDAE